MPYEPTANIFMRFKRWLNSYLLINSGYNDVTIFPTTYDHEIGQLTVNSLRAVVSLIPKPLCSGFSGVAIFFMTPILDSRN